MFVYCPHIGRFEELTPKVNETKLITDSLWKAYEVCVTFEEEDFLGGARFASEYVLIVCNNICWAVHGRPGPLDGVHQRAVGCSWPRDLHRP